MRTEEEKDQEALLSDPMESPKEELKDDSGYYPMETAVMIYSRTVDHLMKSVSFTILARLESVLRVRVHKQTRAGFGQSVVPYHHTVFQLCHQVLFHTDDAVSSWPVSQTASTQHSIML